MLGAKLQFFLSVSFEESGMSSSASESPSSQESMAISSVISSSVFQLHHPHYLGIIPDPQTTSEKSYTLNADVHSSIMKTT